MKVKSSRSKLVSIILFTLLLGTLLSSFLLLKCYVKYRTGHPPTTYMDSSSYTDNDLVFHWEFDKIIGDFTPDASKNKINGRIKYYFDSKILSKVLYSPPVVTVEDNGKALSFDGKHWISAGNKFVYNAEQFTICAWIFQENDDVFMPTIMAKSSWHENNDGFDGWWLCTTPKGRFLDIGIAWGNGQKHIKSGYQLPLREWHHVAVTINRKHNEIQFYIDGRRFGEIHKDVPKWVDNWNHDLLVGGYDGSQQWPWVGKLDDIRFYSSTLSSDKIAGIYRSHYNNRP